jgi:endonuclease I
MALSTRAEATNPFGEIPGEGTPAQASVTIRRVCPDFERTYGSQPVYVEPTDAARGDLARSLIYMHFVYGLDLAAVVDDPDRLLLWSQNDPVDSEELMRDAEIAARQGSGNPLIGSQAAPIF